MGFQFLMLKDRYKQYDKNNIINTNYYYYYLFDDKHYWATITFKYMLPMEMIYKVILVYNLMKK